ncbi:hypothetical protein EV663_101132 [Rhodovulum bhavnagarense]|uniref:DUF1178 family protein n=1 Tax=Rhodovulum bhavnagarense TaxID=992286 RepID=A0A4R2RGQ4_9RHOB|nr:DUF1178 family protein [Rhodovulum bhavnagarense]TCP62872.1 hypothetical protein EV663_101132 [Rhodovulum bhavnagarense]
MIRYTLNCAEGHRFESWFQSAETFEALHAAGQLACAICGGRRVDKGLMAPNVASSTADDTPPPPETGLAAPAHPAQQALAALRRHVEENSDYVGLRFVQEARDMHEGLTPERPIHGEAKLEDAKKLIDEGIPVAPLPFAIGRKTN